MVWPRVFRLFRDSLGQWKELGCMIRHIVMKIELVGNSKNMLGVGHAVDYAQMLSGLSRQVEFYLVEKATLSHKNLLRNRIEEIWMYKQEGRIMSGVKQVQDPILCTYRLRRVTWQVPGTELQHFFWLRWGFLLLIALS